MNDVHSSFVEFFSFLLKDVNDLSIKLLDYISKGNNLSRKQYLSLLLWADLSINLLNLREDSKIRKGLLELLKLYNKNDSNGECDGQF